LSHAAAAAALELAPAAAAFAAAARSLCDVSSSVSMRRCMLTRSWKRSLEALLLV
jgi:hypothetical protein